VSAEIEIVFTPTSYDSGYTPNGNVLFLKREEDLEHELTEITIMKSIEKLSGLNFFKSYFIPHILTVLGSKEKTKQ